MARKYTFVVALNKLLSCRCERCKGTGNENYIAPIAKEVKTKKKCKYCDGSGFDKSAPVFVYKVYKNGGRYDI